MDFSLLIVFSKTDKLTDLTKCLNSCLANQTVKPSQTVLVLNGFSQVESHNLSKMYNIFNITYLRLAELNYLSQALNYGLDHCDYELIARMDPDDISCNQRFELQLERFAQDKKLVLSGGAIKKGKTLKYYPEEQSNIIRYSYLRNPFAHPSVMFKKTIVRKLGGYPVIPKVQDYLLWLRLLKAGHKAENIKDVLVIYNTNGLSIRRSLRYFQSEANVLAIAWKEDLIPKYCIIISYVVRLFGRMYYQISH